MSSLLRVRGTRFLLIPLLVAGFFVVGVSAAEAAPTFRSKSLSYNQTVRVYSAPLKRCINVTLSGTITFSYRPYGRPGLYLYKNPELVNPKMRIGIGNKCAAGARHVNLYKLEISQSWHERKCKWNPTVSAGLHWTAVSVGVSPTCGDDIYAQRLGSYGKSYVYEQYTSGNPVVWKHQRGAMAKTGPCMDAIVHGTAYSKVNKSDDFVINGFRVCMRVA